VAVATDGTDTKGGAKRPLERGGAFRIRGGSTKVEENSRKGKKTNGGSKNYASGGRAA